MTPQYDIYRSKKRHSVAIKVLADSSVKIYVPYFYSKKNIDILVNKNRSWIKQKKEEVLKKNEKKKLLSGSNLLFLGKNISLNIISVPNLTFPFVTLFKENLLTVRISSNIPEKESQAYLSEQIKHWYQTKINAILPERVTHWSSQMGVSPKNIRIKSLKSRWGSCSSKKNLNFNWKIVMALPEAIDYLIIHELAHLKHLNHSIKFWNFVKEFSPNYQAMKKSLRDVERLSPFFA